MHLRTPSRSSARHSFGRQSLARRGFSLLEVLVAVTIIAILAALVVPKVYNQVFKAKVTRAKADATAVANALKIYLTQNGMRTLPSDFELEALADGADPVLEKAGLRDPWGNPWGLRVPGTDRDFDVVSYGADGQPGGDGDNEDIIHN